MKHLMILFCLGLILGCATTKKYEDGMQAMVGQNINHVIDQLGPPNQTFKRPDGDTTYTWNSVGGSRSTANTVGTTQVVNTTTHYCDASYTAGTDNIIKSWFHRGNWCVSK